MQKNRHDVIIVGAGPIGSYAGCLLAREGLNVAIFEKNAEVGADVNCTGIISVDCLERFNLPRDAVLREIAAIRAYAPSGDYLRYSSDSTIAYVVDRARFDSRVNEMAVGQGVVTYLNANVEDIEVTGGSFKVKVLEYARHHEYESQVGIIATGFRTRGFRVIPAIKRAFLFGAQTDVRMEQTEDVEVYFGEKVAPGSFAWVVPSGSGTAKIGLMVKKEPVAQLEHFLDHPAIRPRIRAVGNGVKCSPIPLKKIARSYGERFLVVGEAAGQVKTTTGGGIYFGLLCAEIAADSILNAFRSGDCSEKSLRRYETEWTARLEPELRAGRVLRNIYSRLSDRQINTLIDFAKKDGVFPFIERARFDWHKDLIGYLIRHLIRKKILGSVQC